LCAKAGDSSDYFDRHFYRSHDQNIDDEKERRDCGRGRVGFAERIAEEEEKESGGGEDGRRGFAFDDRIA